VLGARVSRIRWNGLSGKIDGIVGWSRGRGELHGENEVGCEVLVGWMAGERVPSVSPGDRRPEFEVGPVSIIEGSAGDGTLGVVLGHFSSAYSSATLAIAAAVFCGRGHGRGKALLGPSIGVGTFVHPGRAMPAVGEPQWR